MEGIRFRFVKAQEQEDQLVLTQDSKYEKRQQDDPIKKAFKLPRRLDLIRRPVESFRQQVRCPFGYLAFASFLIRATDE
jgi:hypothetical protein